MRNALVFILAMLVVATLFCGIAMADENYYGEDDDQPGIGVDESPGDGTTPSDDVGDAGESPRTRFKD